MDIFGGHCCAYNNEVVGREEDGLFNKWCWIYPVPIEEKSSLTSASQYTKQTSVPNDHKPKCER